MAIINYSDLFDIDGTVAAFKRAEQANKEFAKISIGLNREIKKSFAEVMAILDTISAASGKKTGKFLAELTKEMDRQVEAGRRQKQMMDEVTAAVEINEQSNKELRNSLATLKKEYDSLRPTEADFIAKQKQLADQAAQVKVALDTQTATLRVATKEAGTAATSYRELNNQTNKMKNQLREMPGAYDLVTGKINQHNAAAVRLQKQIQQNDKALKMMDATMGNHQRNVGNYSGALNGLSNKVAGLAQNIGGLIGVTTTFQAVIGAVQVIARMERLNTALENASGSSTKFAENQRMVRGLIETTGTDIEKVTKSYIKFTAATQGTNLEGEKANQIFSSFTKTFAALGASNEAVERGLLAVEQMISKGTVGAEELRQQLGDSLPGSVRLFMEAYKELYNQQDLTMGEFMKLMKANKVYAEEILPVVARKIEEAYGSKAEKNLKTITGSMTNLTNQFKLLLSQLNQTGVVSSFFSTLFNGASSVVKFLQQNNWTALISPVAALGGPQQKDDGLSFEQRTEQERLNIIQRNNKKLADLINERDRILKDSSNGGVYAQGMQRALDKVKSDIEKQTKEVERLLVSHDRVVSMEKYDASMVTPVSPINTPSDSDDKLKKTTSEVEKLTVKLDNLRDVLLDQILARVEKGEPLVVKPETLKTWDDLYEKLRKIAEFSGTELPKNLRDLNEKLRPGLKNVLDDDSNTQYGRVQKWDEPQSVKEEDPSKMRDLDLRRLVDAEGAYNQSMSNLDTLFGDEGKLRMAGEAQKNKIAAIYKEIYALRNQTDNDYTKNRERALNEEVRMEMEAAAKIVAQRKQLVDQSIELGAQMVNAIFEINNQNREAEMENLRKQYEYDLEMAGDNEEKKKQIKKSYEKQERELRQQKARADKAQAAFSIVLSTAQAVAAALAAGPPLGVALAIVAGAMGAVQLATVLSKPIPAFEKGTKFAPEGPALVAEKGAELRESKGKFTLYDKPQIANLKKGDKIYTAKETSAMLADAYLRQEFMNDAMQRSITGNKTAEDIIKFGGPVIVQNSNFDYDKVISGFAKALDDRPQHNTYFDENGVHAWLEKKSSRIHYLKNRFM